MNTQGTVTSVTSADALNAHAAPGFSVGGVFADTFRASRRTFLIGAPIAIAIHLLWLLVSRLIDSGVEANAWWLTTSDTVTGMFTTSLVETTLTLVILRGLRNEKSSMADVIRGLGRAVPVIGAGILYFLPEVGLDLLSHWRDRQELVGAGVLVPSIALLIAIVPLVILSVMWWVAGPAIVCEGLGPIDGLARSAYLTKGRRWPVFGLIMLDLVVVGIVLYFLSKATGIPIDKVLEPDTFSLPAVIAFVVTALIAVFSSLLGVTAYDRLKHEKDGAPVHEVARVFD